MEDAKASYARARASVYVYTGEIESSIQTSRDSASETYALDSRILGERNGQI